MKSEGCSLQEAVEFAQEQVQCKGTYESNRLHGQGISARQGVLITYC